MLSHFFAMGGYAFYVWTAYGAGAIVLSANVIIPLLKQRRLKKQLLKRMK